MYQHLYRQNAVCRVCNVGPAESRNNHEHTTKHRFNSMLHLYARYRKALSKNRGGISIDVHIVSQDQNLKNHFKEENFNHVTSLTPQQFQNYGNSITYSFNITNTSNYNICLVNVWTMCPTILFRLDVTPQSVILTPRASYTVLLQFSLPEPTIGTFKMPLLFMFQTVTKEKPSQTEIIKSMVIKIGTANTNSDYTQSPFSNQKWDNVKVHLSPLYKISNHEFKIPKECRVPFSYGLDGHHNMSIEDWNEAQSLTKLLNKHFDPATRKHTGQNENYDRFYHILLWMNELTEEYSLEKFNMEKVPMYVNCGNFIKIKVPGLAEKRPSILTGDLITVRKHNADEAYQGKVFRVEAEYIFVKGLHDDIFEMLDKKSNELFDVRFELNRISYIRQHEAIDLMHMKNLMYFLHPDKYVLNQARSLKHHFEIPDQKFINPNIVSNEEQKRAVRNIINCSSVTAPFIVFGPPGTGKTMTLVEAILQILIRFPTKRILVCAPSNSACDVITQKLLKQRIVPSKSQMLRVHAVLRDIQTIPKDILNYSNIREQQIHNVEYKQMKNCQILIMTLVHCGKYRKCLKPDFLFIDEAAQALETEVNIPISMITGAGDCQVVLAGDPKQLSPIVSCKTSGKFGLDISILERLMDQNDIYKTHNENFITMLKLNYRSHPAIISLPNEFFYFNELRPVSKDALSDVIARVAVGPKIFANNSSQKNIPKNPGYPLEFYAVYAKEEREGKSPSFFNTGEVKIVKLYVEALLRLPNCSVKQADIGIITPYIRQVYKIKDALKMYPDIEVGTTEAYQGREKRIILISTVRGQHSLLLHDKKYNIGFVANEKRFNVAVTRAISKLVVIGNPLVLSTNMYWFRYIEQCEAENSYYGIQNIKRDERYMNYVMDRLKNFRINSPFYNSRGQ